MANNKTNYLENAVVDHVLGTASLSSPADVYLALFTADPGEAGAQTNEVDAGEAGVGYAREVITFDAASGGSAANSNAPAFGPCTTTPWGTVTHIGLMDAAGIGDGNMLYYGPLTVSKTIGVGDDLSFAIGAVVVAET